MIKCNYQYHLFATFETKSYIVEARKLEHGFRRIRARILTIYLKGMRRMMFQLSGFYCMML